MSYYAHEEEMDMSYHLGDQQRKFTLMTAKLIEFAYANGYELTYGDAYATTGHKHMSLHYVRLAVDFNLFKDGEYLTDGKDHAFLHDYWDTLGGSERIEGDMNHYSLAYAGRR